MEIYAHYFADWIFSYFCHQDPNHLINITGQTLPVCSRCGFIYIGIFTSYLVLFVYRKNRFLWQLGALFVAFLLCEWVISNIGLHPSSTLSRSLSGFTGGVGVTLILSSYKRFAWNWFLALLIIILIFSLIIFSSQTLIINLILFTFFIFWTHAFMVIYQIITKIKGVSYEFE
jgi:uncharacterized membrane protein